MNNRNWRGAALWVFFVVILLFIWQSMRQVNVEKDISYSEFKRRLHEGQIVSLTVRTDQIRGRSHIPEGKDEFFRTIPLNDPGLVEDLERYRVRDYSGEVDRGWFSMLLVNAV